MLDSNVRNIYDTVITILKLIKSKFYLKVYDSTCTLNHTILWLASQCVCVHSPPITLQNCHLICMTSSSQAVMIQFVGSRQITYHHCDPYILSSN